MAGRRRFAMATLVGSSQELGEREKHISLGELIVVLAICAGLMWFVIRFLFPIAAN